MRTIWMLAPCLCACTVLQDEPCDAPPEEVYDTQVLDAQHSQAYLTTPPAAKDCHAEFTARVAYLGDLSFDPTMDPPIVDLSANAVGVGGEQPGLLGIMTTWTRAEDPDTSAFAWWATMDAGAKNIDAPAVIYGLYAVMQPGQTEPFEVYSQIVYRAADVSTRTACR